MCALSARTTIFLMIIITVKTATSLCLTARPAQTKMSVCIASRLTSSTNRSTANLAQRLSLTVRYAKQLRYVRSVLQGTTYPPINHPALLARLPFPTADSAILLRFAPNAMMILGSSRETIPVINAAIWYRTVSGAGTMSGAHSARWTSFILTKIIAGHAGMCFRIARNVLWSKNVQNVFLRLITWILGSATSATKV